MLGAFRVAGYIGTATATTIFDYTLGFTRREDAGTEGVCLSEIYLCAVLCSHFTCI